MRKTLVASVVLLIANASASAYTCEDFRNDLFTAIGSAGDRVAQPNLEKLGFEREDKSLRRYEMEGIVGLKGALFCKGDGSFDRLEAEVPDVQEKDVLRLYRLERLASAAICAVSKSTKPRECEEIADRTLKRTMAEFTKAYVRGEPGPSAFHKITAKSGFEAQFDASPGLLMFGVWAPIPK